MSSVGEHGLAKKQPKSGHGSAVSSVYIIPMKSGFDLIDFLEIRTRQCRFPTINRGSAVSSVYIIPMKSGFDLIDFLESF